MTKLFIKHRYLRYGLAVMAAFVGFFLRLALDYWVSADIPTYITFYPAVMLVALLGGVGPGIVTTAVAMLIAAYWILPPIGSFKVETLHDMVALVFFVCMGAGISVVAGLYRNIRRNLETLVATRTQDLSDANAALKQQVELIDPARAEIIVREMERVVRERRELRLSPVPEAPARQPVSLVAGTLVMCVSLTVLAGMAFGIGNIKTAMSEFVEMKVNTAVCFVLAGLALLLHAKNAWRNVFSWVVGLIGVLALVEHLAGINTGVDRLLFHEFGLLPTTALGRVAPETTLCFVFVAVALLVMKTHQPVVRLMGQMLSLLVGIVGAIATIGYVFGEHRIYGFGSTTGMAFLTAASFVALAIGLIFAETENPTSRLGGRGPGAQLMRRMLPVVLLIPIGLAWLCEKGVSLGFYGENLGTAMFAIAVMISLPILIWWTAVALDRGEARRTEIETQLRNQAQLMDQSSEALIVREMDGVIRSWNRGATDLYGWSAAEALSQRLHILLQTEGLPPDHDALLRQQGHWEGELQHKTRDGHTVIVECRKTALRTQDGRMLVLESNRDITDRKQAEAETARLHVELEKYAAELRKNNETLEASRSAALNLMEDSVTARDRTEEINLDLRESQERLKRAQEIAHLGSWELDLIRNRLTWSDEVYRIFGLHPQEFGATYEAFLEYVHPDDRAAVDAAYSSSLRENRDTYEIEHRVIRKDTGEIRVVHERCQHFRDAAGRIIRSDGMVHDITERKQAEQELLRTAKELGRSNKDLEQFAHVTSHDLKEPLRMVTGFMSLLKERYGDKLDAKALEYIGFASEAGGRMQKMVDDLLAYARAGRDDASERTDVAAVVDAALENLRIGIEESGARITRDPLPVIHGQSLGLTQIFQNLIGNAIKFRKPGTPPEIHIGAKKITGSQALAKTDQAPMAGATMRHDASLSYWLFSVQDHGIGLDPQFADRIFVIFQRLHTREKYPGSGVGLAICKKIVEQHGGSIWVESKPGSGATFCFTLPDTRKEA